MKGDVENADDLRELILVAAIEGEVVQRDSSSMANLTTLDTVANLKPIARDCLTLIEPDYQAIQQLPIGQVGTIVEVYPGEPPCYLVEFADLQGREYAMAVLRLDEVLALHYELSLAG